MFTKIIRNLHAKRSVNKGVAKRSSSLLRLEALEDRALLSVSPIEYAQIWADNAALGLPSVMRSVNIIEIETANLSVENIKSAIETAASTPGDDLILVRTSETVNTLSYESSDDELTFDFDASTSGKLSIVSFGTEKLTLSGAQLSRVVSVGVDAEVGFGGVRFIDGQSEFGGGGASNLGTVVMIDCEFANNVVLDTYDYGGGGGLNNLGDAVLIDCTFSANRAPHGGGVCNEPDATLTASGCVWTENTAASTINYYVAYGGGMCDSGTTTLDDCVFSGNMASSGAGLAVWARNNSKTFLEATDTKFVENIVSPNQFSKIQYYANGGGVFMDGGEVVLNRCELSRNLGSVSSGGYAASGVGLAGDGSLEMTDCDICDNYSDTPHHASGVGISFSGTTTMTRCNVMRNTTTAYYSYCGGMSLFSSDSNIVDCVFAENSAANRPGVDFSGTGTFTNCEFLDNYLAFIERCEGGGFYNSVYGDALLIDCKFHGNTASRGAAVANEGELTMVGCDISENHTTYLEYSQGGGVYTYGAAAKTTLIDCRIVDNVASDKFFVIDSSRPDETMYLKSQGGGVYNGYKGTTVLIGCEISGNSATYGGGIYNYYSYRDSDLTTTTLVNCTVAGNVAVIQGGGLFNNYGQAPYAAEEKYADGVNSSSGIVTPYNSIFVFNRDGSGVDDVVGYLSFSSSHNAIGIDPGFVVAPQFDANGELTNRGAYDLRLRPNGAGVDAGLNMYVDRKLLYDLDGKFRFCDGNVDLGAYERYRLPNINEDDVYLLGTLGVSILDENCVWELDSNYEYRLVDYAGELEFCSVLTSVQATSGSSVAVSLPSAEYATRYVLSYSTNADMSDCQTVEFQTSGEHAIDGLTPNTTYYFQLQTIFNDSFAATPSSVLSTTTESALTAPTVSKIASATTSSLNVSFSASSGQNVTALVLEYSTSADFSENVGRKTFTKSGVGKVSNLQPGTTYYFRAKAKSGELESVWSSVKSASTLSVVVEPENPELVVLTPPTVSKVASATTSSLNVSFSASSGQNVTALVLEYSTSADFSENVGRKTFTKSGVGKVSNLQSGTTYYFRVKAMSGTNESDWSSVMTGTTLL